MYKRLQNKTKMLDRDKLIGNLFMIAIILPLIIFFIFWHPILSYIYYKILSGG